MFRTAVEDDRNAGGPGDPTQFLGRILHLSDPGARSRTALTAGAGDKLRLSYGRLAGSAAAVRQHLVAAQVQPGDRVAIVARYGPDWVATFLGILACGAVAVPLDPNLGAHEIAPLLHDADPAVVFSGPATGERVRAAVDSAAIPARALPLPTPAADSVQALPQVPRRPEDPAVIVYTSGTTGAAKGVVISWANLAYQVASIGQRQRVSRDAVFVSILPAHHMFELVCGCLTPLYIGGQVHYPGSLLPADIVAAIAQYRASDLVVVPLLLTALRRRIDGELARAPAARRIAFAVTRQLAARLPFVLRRRLLAPVHARFGGNLRKFFVGGAPLDPELAAYFERLGFHVCQGYGMSETSPIVSSNTPWENRLGSVGRLLPGTEVRIEEGEILVRGPGVMLGYWGQPELTAETIDGDGWLRTGDMGFLDEDGYLFVTGRAKNLIVLPNGENVQPEELESVIRRSPLIGDVCVLGRPGARGEEIVAVVTPSEQARAEFTTDAAREQAVKAEVRRLATELVPYKRPGKIVVHAGDLPQTPTRKVRRADVDKLLNTIGECAPS